VGEKGRKVEIEKLIRDVHGAPGKGYFDNNTDLSGGNTGKSENL